MKAAYIEKTGPPENIVYGDLPMPVVGSADVLVKVSAVCVNPVDTYLRSGKSRIPLPMPFILGRDMAGVVEAVGSAVKLVGQASVSRCRTRAITAGKAHSPNISRSMKLFFILFLLGMDDQLIVAFVHSWVDR